jgi:cell division septation protein DedD
MKVSSVIILALLSTVATTLANPMKRAADAATQAANAQDAINLNNQFASLTANSPCTSGQSACVNGQFAQCVGSKFALSPCAAGTTCCALPLVNKRGTSITCDTIADRDARIAAAGGGSAPAASPPAAASPSTPPPATTSPKKHGKNKNKNSSTPASSPAAAPATSPAAAPATSPAPAGGSDISSIRKQNAADAIALQQSFSSLTANSPCTDGQDACINGQFAQCSGGKFAVSPCSGGTQCFALPLVNKKGTSVTCDTQADRDARIQAAQNGQS